MIKTEDFDIVGSYNQQIYSSIDAERSVNLFEYHDMKGKKPKSLVNTSGLINTDFLFGSVTGGFRAQFVFNNIEYNVIGNSIFLITSDGNISFLGTISNSSGYVGVDANTFQIIFVNGQNGYVWDTLSSTFTKITDPSFPLNPIDVTFLDGFFTVANGNTNNFYLSSFNQGLIWGSDNNGTETTFTMAASSSHLVLTYHGGSINNYQIGTPIVFSGGSLPAEITAGITYYVQSIVSSSTITISATDGGSAITSASGGSGSLTNNGQLQVGSITTHPGTIVACRTLHRRLFLFSQYYTEVWENAGIGTNLPFRRNNALLMEYGTPALGSISVGFDMMIFLSQTRDGLGSVMQVKGTESVPISTSALDAVLAMYANNQEVSDCRGFLIKENNIIFYRMNFTAANHTYVYNVTMSDPSSDVAKLWHEEETLNGDRHVAQTHAYFNGINYVGHYSLPILYVLDNNTFTNDGEAIKRMRITRAFVPPGYQRLRIDRLQIDLLQGNIEEVKEQYEEINLTTEDSIVITNENNNPILLEQEMLISNPQNLSVFLSISKDGGQTYGYKLRAPMGFVGQRTFRTVWRKLGTIPRGQAFVAKFEFFQQVPFVVLGASWAKEILPE